MKRERQTSFALVKKHFESAIERDIEALKPIMAMVKAVVQERLPAAVAQGQLEALQKGGVPAPRADYLRQLDWHLVVAQEELILGDLGPALETGGGFRLFPDEGGNIKRVFLSISPYRVIVGTHKEEAPVVRAPMLNDGCALCSTEFIVGASKGIVEHYVSRINTQSPLLRHGEREVFLEQLLKEIT